MLQSKGKGKESPALMAGRIISMFSGNTNAPKAPTMELLMEIGAYVEPSVDMGSDGQSYNVSLDINKLTKSGISENILMEMVEKGWKLSKDKKKVIFSF